MGPALCTKGRATPRLTCALEALGPEELEDGSIHHQHVTPSLSVVLESTTLSSKGMKSGGSQGMFPRARTIQDKSISSHIPWPGFTLMGISLQASWETIG